LGIYRTKLVCTAKGKVILVSKYDAMKACRRGRLRDLVPLTDVFIKKKIKEAFQTKCNFKNVLN
jgi:hypothetical protein